MRILLVGGGSGGHVFPLIAVAEALRERSVQTGAPLELMVIGEGEFIQKASLEHGLNFKPIIAGKLRRYFSLLTLLDILKIPIGFLQSLWHIFWFMPDVIFSKGGYSSVTSVVVGKLYFIPVYIHESDSVPGLANRLLAKLSKRIFISFKSSEKYFNVAKTILVGNPVRREIAQGDRNEAAKVFNLDPSRKTILVLGGSQGAQKINKIILDSLVMMVGPNASLQIIHQCGESQYQTVKTEVEKIIKEGENHYAQAIQTNYKVYPFFNEKELALAYAAADVFVSRAGSGNIFEIALIGKPAIIIPITNSSSNHQLENALEFSRFGATLIEEENLTPHILINQINSIFEPARYNVVSQKIKSFATPDAAQKIAEMLFSEIKM